MGISETYWTEKGKWFSRREKTSFNCSGMDDDLVWWQQQRGSRYIDVNKCSWSYDGVHLYHRKNNSSQIIFQIHKSYSHSCIGTHRRYRRTGKWHILYEITRPALLEIWMLRLDIKIGTVMEKPWLGPRNNRRGADGRCRLWKPCLTVPHCKYDILNLKRNEIGKMCNCSGNIFALKFADEDINNH